MGEEPSAEDLVKAITFEIEAVRSSHSGAGWTPWALALGAATALGLLLDVLATRSVHLGHSGIALIMASLAWDIVDRMRTLVPAVRLGGDEARVVQVRHFELVNGAEVMAFALRPIAVIVALLSARGVLPGWLVVLGVLFSLGDAWGRLLVLLLSQSDVALPLGGHTERKLNLVRITWWLGIGSATMRSVALAAVVISVARARYMDVQALRVGLLAAALLLVLERLSAWSEQPPTTRILLDLRRDLLLGRRAPAQSRRDFEAAVMGLQLPDFLAEEAQRLLIDEQRLSAMVEDIRSELERLEVTSSSDRPKQAAQLEALERRMGAVREKHQACSNAMTRSLNRLKWLAPFVDLSRSGADMHTKLTAELQRHRAAAEDVSTRLRALSTAPTKMEIGPAPRPGT